MNQRFKDLWLAETIRLIEQTDHFADSEANRQAKGINGNLTHRILFRAKLIAQQIGLLDLQRRYIKVLQITLFALFFMALLIGTGLSFTALSQEPVNIFWALISLLGLNFVMLLIWLFSFLLLPKESGSLFVQLWLWLSHKFAAKQTTQQFLPALMALSGHQIRWAISFVVNLFWTLILLSSFLILVILFSAKHYSFVWQTTLLNAHSFIWLTQSLGAFPALLGFAVPDVETIRQSGVLALSAGEVRSSWAIWLLGVFLAYGLLPRMILMLISGFIWSIKQRTAQLNLALPAYQLLAQRLQPFSCEGQIVDPNLIAHELSQILPLDRQGRGQYLVAIEVYQDWQPPISVDFSFLGCLNQRQQRQQVLDYLQQYPAQKLLIAIDTQRAPDRGILNLIIALINKSQQTRIWLLNEGKQYQNWRADLAELALLTAQPDWLTEVG
ncbi:DUF2868 domain-containing protein [Utexia brackfieldae]|uniref:DUF2868 domain-containing protein n=1 Tax=Utexia brackfieldae TaxID=3074108 RepID=UPI00370D1E31